MQQLKVPRDVERVQSVLKSLSQGFSDIFEKKMFWLVMEDFSK